MNGLSRKLYLQLPAPSREDQISAQGRILRELPEEYGKVKMPCRILRQLYPLCQEAEWKVTVTLAFTGAGWELVRLEPGDKTQRHYGICADLGSTTLAAELVDCNTGRILARESVYNEQISFGEDILNRIFYAKDNPEHLEEIKNATVKTFQKVFSALRDKTGIDEQEYSAMTVAGNTTMIHFLIGMDPFCIFASPYAVQADRPDFLAAAELGFSFPGYVYCYPGKANYLGGDIVSGIIAEDITNRDELCVFLDIGTNGELVVGNKDFLLCGAGAAGPALEGGSVKTGMRAHEGAVQYVKLEKGNFKLDVIGGGEPRGICGSGIVDLIAEMFLQGWVDIRGHFVPDASEKIQKRGEEYAVEYAPSLWFFQSDLDEFIRTKAAAGTMVEYMLNLAGISSDMIGEFIVSGAFGTYLDKESAVTIGLYPDMDRERLVSAGNTSLEGAYRMLLDRTQLQRVDWILGQMEYVQFGEVADFIQLMGAASALPHTDMDRYPSVKKKLAANGIKI